MFKWVEQAQQPWQAIALKRSQQLCGFYWCLSLLSHCRLILSIKSGLGKRALIITLNKICCLIMWQEKKENRTTSSILECPIVHTMSTNVSNRLQRSTALVAKALSRFDTDIAAVSEVCFTEQGSLTEHSACYTLYWSSKGLGNDVRSWFQEHHRKQA